MTSTRLPGKVLLEVAGRSMLEYHVEHLRQVGVPIIVATTTNAADDPIGELSTTLGATVSRGSEEDVLGRFVGAALEHRLDVVVRVTSDCPLIDGEVVKKGIDAFLALEDPQAFVSNTVVRTFPRGMDFEIFSAESLFMAGQQATSHVEREHVTPYIYRNSVERGVTRQITRENDASRYRITLDTHEDFSFIAQLIEQYSGALLSVEQLIRVLEQHPELAQINASVMQKQLED